MATLRNKQKLAALNKKNHEEHPRSNQVWDTNVPRSQEDYITQVSEEIDGRVTKKLPREASKTESLILLNPLIQGHFGSVPKTSPNTYGES